MRRTRKRCGIANLRQIRFWGLISILTTLFLFQYLYTTAFVPFSVEPENHSKSSKEKNSKPHHEISVVSSKRGNIYNNIDPIEWDYTHFHRSPKKWKTCIKEVFPGFPNASFYEYRPIVIYTWDDMQALLFPHEVFLILSLLSSSTTLAFH
jgi:hypothetical protein